MRIPPALPRVSDEDRKAITDFLTRAPLYGNLTVEGIWLNGDTLERCLLPSEIQRQCERCGLESRWHLDKAVEGESSASVMIGYRCRNCSVPFAVWIRWRHEYGQDAIVAMKTAELNDVLLQAAGAVQTGDVAPTGQFHFQKCGQYPAPSINLPADLAKALGKHEGLYRKAMVSRNQNFGIGALGYFRRIVEDTANDMLDLLIEALREHAADAEVMKRIEGAKQERIFEKKAKIAADALPELLRPGGANPFQSLHDQYSKGLHGLSDEECIEIIDRMREDVVIIFKTLKTHVDDRKAYGAAVQRLQHRKPQAQ